MWLIKLEDNWADELNLRGFAVMSNAQFMAWARTVEKVANKIEEGHNFVWYIGTNEYVDYETGADFKAAFTCEAISDTQVAVLKQLLLNSKSDTYGIFPSLNEMNWWLEDLEKDG